MGDANPNRNDILSTYHRERERERELKRIYVLRQPPTSSAVRALMCVCLRLSTDRRHASSLKASLSLLMV